MLAATSVAWASSSAWEGPQPTIAVHVRIIATKAILFTLMLLAPVQERPLQELSAKKAPSEYQPPAWRVHNKIAITVSRIS